MVILETNKGNIEIELFEAEAPTSVANFLQYVDDGFYAGTVFHRVISGFMIQGGGMTADMGRKNTRAPIKNEAKNGLKNQRGTLAMARTTDIDSATSQFFINLVDNDFLDHGTRDYGYAVFGKVKSGMDVVDAIGAAKTGARDVPVETIEITKAYRS
ncbi:MAG: peptidylprolyl isomerase [Acidobacteria bacterium]|nr:peptidylprolyl isomerase [Acidobacteriota bacterium]